MREDKTDFRENQQHKSNNQFKQITQTGFKNFKKKISQCCQMKTRPYPLLQHSDKNLITTQPSTTSKTNPKYMNQQKTAGHSNGLTKYKPNRKTSSFKSTKILYNSASTPPPTSSPKLQHPKMTGNTSPSNSHPTKKYTTSTKSPSNSAHPYSPPTSTLQKQTILLSHRSIFSNSKIIDSSSQPPETKAKSKSLPPALSSTQVSSFSARPILPLITPKQRKVRCICSKSQLVNSNKK